MCEVTHDIKTSILSEITGVRSPIAATRGCVHTESGIGLLMQRIGPAQGGVGPTLNDFVKNGGIDDVTMKNLNDFAKSFFKLKIVAADINVENILLQQIDDQYIPYIVDGFGDRNFIKLRTYVRWFRHRSLHLGMERLAHEINLKWSRSSRYFQRRGPVNPVHN